MGVAVVIHPFLFLGSSQVNSVCFNAHTGAALVEHIPPVVLAPKKRKAEEDRNAAIHRGKLLGMGGYP